MPARFNAVSRLTRASDFATAGMKRQLPTKTAANFAANARVSRVQSAIMRSVQSLQCAERGGSETASSGTRGRTREGLIRQVLCN
jgi:hypothetical protein